MGLQNGLELVVPYHDRMPVALLWVAEKEVPQANK